MDDRSPSSTETSPPGVPDQGIAEMLGLVRGVLADGVVNDAEAEALAAWVREHPTVTRHWPGDVLHRRLERIFADGRVDDAERADLADLLTRILEGAPAPEGNRGGEGGGGSVDPFDDPPPFLRFQGRTFVFSGRFAYGSRAACHRAVVRLGGRYAAEVDGGTDYLVVGTFHGRDWAESHAGPEIQRALRARREGGKVAVVSEAHWVASLPGESYSLAGTPGSRR